MAARGGAISGLAVGAATGGGLLIYAALRGVTPLEAMRDVLSGNPPSVPRGPSVRVEEEQNISRGLSPDGTPLSGPNGWLATTAMTQRGVPYSWGGESPSGFDCSGLVQWSFRQHGISSPRTTYDQVVWSKLRSISRSQVAAGDLIYSSGHVVIAISNSHCVAAQRRGTNVKTLPIANAFSSPIIAYKRYVGPKPNVTTGQRPAQGWRAV